MTRIVVIGGGFGGLAAARALARAPASLTLLDRNNYHLFQPLLYQVATAGLSPGDIASPIRWILRRQANARVLLDEAKAVDLGRRVIRLTGGELEYDFLILAPGVRHAYFGHDEWQDAAPGLKDLADALEIRRRVLLAFERAEWEADPQAQRRLLTMVVVGGGPTGVELAGALAEISRHALANEFRSIEPQRARIVLIEAAGEILQPFPATLRAAAHRSLVRLGVEVRRNSPVTAVAPGALTAGGEKIAAGTILWAAGVAAAPVLRSLDIPRDGAGRALVRPDLSVPGHPEVFVIGDAAAFLHQDGRPLPGVAQVAMQQGRCAAQNIRAALAGRPAREFRYKNLGNLATIGRSAAVADFGWIRFSGGLAWWAWLFIHILKLVGFRNRIQVLIQWAWAYVTYQRSVRLILGGGRR